jgi:Protein of unknown function (DUF3313)
MKSCENIVVATLPRQSNRDRKGGAFALIVASAAGLGGCTSMDLRENGALATYSNLGKETGRFTKSRVFVDAAAVHQAKTVRIVPASFSYSAAARISKASDRALVANAVDRALCVALSDRYVVVSAGQPADLTVRSYVADIKPTNKVVAGVSSAVTLGSGFVLPVSVPRLPYGLGGLSVEGEALDAQGQQVAAIIWSKGANSLTSGPRVSEVGDAYTMAATYGDGFSKLLIKGKQPSMFDFSLPSRQRINAFFGAKPKYPACDTFGRSPGVPGLVAGVVGAPPEWTDKAAQKKP